MAGPNKILKYSWEIHSDILFFVTEGNSQQLINNSYALSEHMEITSKGKTMARNSFNITNESYLFH